MSRKLQREYSAVRPSRLVIEQLETRQLLAGINVWVYSDLNGSRSYETAMDSPAANRLVYIDLDEDGSLDPREPLSVSNSKGMAEFRDIAPGRYQVALVNSNPAQAQVFPIAVNAAAQIRNRQSAAQLVSTSDLSLNWLVSPQGRVSILDQQGAVQKELELGGVLTSAIDPVGTVAWGVVRANSGTRLVRLDLAQASVDEVLVNNLPEGFAVTQVTRIGEQLAVEFESSSGRYLSTLDMVDGTVSRGKTFQLPSDARVVGSPAGNLFATVHRAASGKSVVSLVSTSENPLKPQAIEVDAAVQRLHFTSNGKQLLASSDEAGVLVFSVVDGAPKLVAELREASEPIAVDAIDGRFVSGNQLRPDELIVWDTVSWQPVSRVTVGGGDAAGGLTSISSINVDRWGSRLLAATSNGTYEINLAQAQSQSVVVVNERTEQVQFGIKTTGSNAQPLQHDQILRSFSEDTVDHARAAEMVQFLRDADGNPLWFTIDATPRHGRLELTTHGEWRYVPAADFYGQDAAVIRAHDGMASSSAITVNINVAGVNDPPVDMRTDVVPIQENTIGVTSLGFITVYDPDRDSQYIFTTSDSRFVVSQGEIFLQPGAILDYERERQIAVDVTAIDVERPEFSITRSTTIAIVDVNEPPISLALSNNRTFENQSGREIGLIVVNDPDGTNDLVYTVSDGRFEVVGGVLRLRAGAELDHESESQVELVVSGAPAEVDTPDVTSTITIIVGDENDPPAGITLSGREILADKEGFVIGTVTVLDQDRSDSYEIYVSDPRFEVVGRTLKLRDDQYISMLEGGSVLITIYAMAQNGDFVSENFRLTVKSKPNSHNNLHNPMDVNNDGFVTAMDALILVNYLNQNGPQELGPEEPGEGELPQYIDVNNDGAVSPIDVLIIINHLNNANPPSAAGESPEVDLRSASTFEKQDDQDSDSVAGAVQMDLELESLLEQLSSERVKRRRA